MDKRKAKYEATRKQINFRLSLDEFDRLSEKVRKSDMTLTEFCKYAVLKKKARPQILTKEETSKILANHGKIGSNINQIAKAINQGKIKLSADEKAMLDEIVKSESDLIAVLLGEKLPKKAQPDKPAAESCSAPLLCPKCHQPMVFFIGNKDKSNGVKYWYCKNAGCKELENPFGD